MKWRIWEMAMINCPECGKEISDKAASCPNCGCPIGFVSTAARGDDTPYIKAGNSPYQSNNPYQSSNPYQAQQSTPREIPYQPAQKNSGLGITALVLSILGCTFWLGAILAIVDLCKKNNNKKTCSVIALCICGLWLVIGIIGASTNDSSQTENNTIQVTNQHDTTEELEADANKAEPEVDQTKSDNSEETDREETNSNAGEQNDIQMSKEDFIASCEEIPYKTLARNPEDYIGKHIKLTVKVSQILQGGFFDDGEYYRVYTNDEYNLWLGDEYFMYDCRTEEDMKILQDDILTVYAECDGTTMVERALTGTKEDVVSIKAIYIELIEDESDTVDVEQDDSAYDGLTVGQKNALDSARSYLDFSAFSYNGLISQLEYEKYSHEDAVFAADNCGADWNEQAVKAAKSYMEFSSFSKDGLIEQLEYEGYTHEQAVHGAEANGY